MLAVGATLRHLGPYIRARKRSGLIFPRHDGVYWATLTRTYPRMVTQLGSARGDFPPCYGHQPLRGVCIAQRTGRPGVKEHAVIRCVRRLLPLPWKSHLPGLKIAICLVVTVLNPHQVSKMSSLWRIEQSSVREFGKPDS